MRAIRDRKEFEPKVLTSIDGGGIVLMLNSLCMSSSFEQLI